MRQLKTDIDQNVAEMAVYHPSIDQNIAEMALRRAKVTASTSTAAVPTPWTKAYLKKNERQWQLMNSGIASTIS